MDDAKTAKYLNKCLNLLPHHYQAEDANRVFLAFCGLAGLERLGQALPSVDVANWILAQMVDSGGFRGGPSVNDASLLNSLFAILCLGLIRVGFEGVSRVKLRRFVASCQRPNGRLVIAWHQFCHRPLNRLNRDYSFTTQPNSNESDLRCTLAALGLHHLTCDPEPEIDLEAAVAYVVDCQRYDGGFAQVPGAESHAGSTFCALASLSLVGRLDLVRDRAGLLRWLCQRLVGPDREAEDEDEAMGYQGRTNKLRDACYSFWIGASLQVGSRGSFGRRRLLTCPLVQMIEPGLSTSINDQALDFLKLCQDPNVGGYGKTPLDYPGTSPQQLRHLCADQTLPQTSTIPISSYRPYRSRLQNRHCDRR